MPCKSRTAGAPTLTPRCGFYRNTEHARGIELRMNDAFEPADRVRGAALTDMRGVSGTTPY